MTVKFALEKVPPICYYIVSEIQERKRQLCRSEKMNVIITDDDKLVAMSLKMIIGADENINVVAMGASADEAIALFKEYKPDIMLMDIRMGESNGLDAATEILTFDADAKILFLTTFADDEYIIKALKIGAKGYILKQSYESIVPALKAVYSGQNVFGEEIVTKLPDILNSVPKQESRTLADFGLSSQEFSLITRVAKGLSNKEIAAEMFLGEGTVRNYLSVILEKLELRDRTQLAIFYYKNDFSGNA